ncbi:MAG: hypothetical protein ACFCA4_18720 [Cyanophyceae cyanobacterium]
MTLATQQKSLIPATSPSLDGWTTDDWETPLYLGRFMQQVLENHIVDAFCGPTSIHPKTCDFILEVGAGNGNISRFYAGDRHYYAIESKYSRISKGRQVFPRGDWMHQDFLQLDLGKLFGGCHYAVISNPPFSQAMEILEHLAAFKPLPRLMVLLLPTAFFQTEERSQRLAQLPFSITAEYRLAGRVGFIRNDIAEPNRQCNDSVFVLQPVKDSPIKIQPLNELRLDLPGKKNKRDCWDDEVPKGK